MNKREVIKELFAEAYKQGYSINSLAEEMGYTSNYISTIKNGKPASKKFIRSISGVLNFNISESFSVKKNDPEKKPDPVPVSEPVSEPDSVPKPKPESPEPPEPEIDDNEVTFL
jgi:transcriptional regulator with XRE-family HTH domain